MPNPADDPIAVAALTEVVADLENTVEALNNAADVIEDGGYSPDLAVRLRSWATVLEAPRHDVNRVVGAAKAKVKGRAHGPAA